MNSNRWTLALAAAFGLSIGSAVFAAPAQADDNQKSVGQQVKDDVKKDAKKKSKEKLKKKLKGGDKKEEGK